MISGRPGRPPSKTASPAASFWRQAGLTTRAANALALRGIGSWEELGARSLRELVTVPNLGGPDPWKKFRGRPRRKGLRSGRREGPLGKSSRRRD
jgi:hypothetical protein